MSSGLHKMIQCNVYHPDIDLGNMSIRQSDSDLDAYPVVLIDFAFSEPFTHSPAYVRYPIIRIVSILQSMGADLSLVETWFLDGMHHGLPWSALFTGVFKAKPNWFNIMANRELTAAEDKSTFVPFPD
ncbi:hypothetical protein SCP_0600800 [Sparassis crispa]|uniref:Protein kinase domain-containing protein n=1 Tax=Sparassis crispa TaxID=139825 RepID=A0A401GPI2_9APHY|nr:hypothetical protein SCP_0600800 [Sparassis crispa]GBE84102.1 hypothetical protein SCP_0600800 [Sparassis crispa]